MLIAMTVAGILLSLALALSLSSRGVYQLDQGRTSLNQTLRNALDIIGSDVRQAGEELPANFPAIVAVDGGVNPDTLVLRINKLTEVLTACAAVNAGASQVLIRDSAAAIPCDPTDLDGNGLPDSAERWVSYRAGAAVKAFIFSPATCQGEFIIYSGEQPGATQSYLTISGVDGNYPQGSSLYILSQRTYQLVAGDLQLAVDQGNFQNLAAGVGDFQIRVDLVDDKGTPLDSSDDSEVVQNGFDQCGSSFDWADVAWLELTLSGSTQVGQQNVDRQVSAQFFPRNVFSN